VKCCDRLERLEVPWGVFTCLPPTCPTFTRLTHLSLADGRHTDAAIAFKSRVWDLMPALVDLHLESPQGVPWEGEGGHRLIVRALEGVAGSLRRLELVSTERPASPAPPAVACHELGVAIGKMRRLSYLSLDIFDDGRAYHAVERGLAASGGCPPLFELRLLGVQQNVDMVTHEPSLIVPSVRRLRIQEIGKDAEATLLLCCGLTRMGYKHRVETKLPVRPGGPTVADNVCIHILRLNGINLVDVE
jgi:hypothetical protein